MSNVAITSCTNRTFQRSPPSSRLPHYSNPSPGGTPLDYPRGFLKFPGENCGKLFILARPHRANCGLRAGPPRNSPASQPRILWRSPPPLPPQSRRPKRPEESEKIQTRSQAAARALSPKRESSRPSGHSSRRSRLSHRRDLHFSRARGRARTRTCAGQLA